MSYGVRPTTASLTKEVLTVRAITEWKGTSTGFLDHRLFQHGRNFPLCMFLIAVEGSLFYLVNNIYVRLGLLSSRTRCLHPPCFRCDRLPRSTPFGATRET